MFFNILIITIQEFRQTIYKYFLTLSCVLSVPNTSRRNIGVCLKPFFHGKLSVRQLLGDRLYYGVFEFELKFPY